MPQWIVALIMKFAVKLGGIQGWVVSKLLSFGGDILVEWYHDLMKKKSRESEQDKKLEEMNQVIKKPESTPEERAKAYEDYINSGR